MVLATVTLTVMDNCYHLTNEKWVARSRVKATDLRANEPAADSAHTWADGERTLLGAKIRAVRAGHGATQMGWTHFNGDTGYVCVCVRVCVCVWNPLSHTEFWYNCMLRQQGLSSSDHNL